MLPLPRSCALSMLTDHDIYAINYNLKTVNGIVYLFGIARTDVEHHKLVNHSAQH